MSARVAKFVVTVRETTDHQIVIAADTPEEARLRAEVRWNDFEDGSFEQSIGPRQIFVRKARARRGK